MVRKGFHSYLAFLHDISVALLPFLDCVSFVREFINVFPTNSPSVPLYKDVFLTIDVDLIMKTISIPPDTIPLEKLKD